MLRLKRNALECGEEPRGRSEIISKKAFVSDAEVSKTGRKPTQKPNTDKFYRKKVLCRFFLSVEKR